MEKIYTMVKSKQRNGGGRTASIKNTVELNTASNNQTQQNQVGNGCCPTWKWNQKSLKIFFYPYTKSNCYDFQSYFCMICPIKTFDRSINDDNYRIIDGEIADLLYE